MPLEIRNEGADNLVEIDDAVRAGADGLIILRGGGNRVAITGPLTIHALNIDIAEGSSVHLGANCYAGFLTLYARRAGHIRIGDGSSFNGATRLLLHEPGRIGIGRDCLFGPDIDVVNSDMHSIIDVTTGARLNPARDVSIGDHVWIGIGAFLAKGTTIGNGSIIGARAFVSGKIPSRCLASGVPATVVRWGVSWRHDLIDASPVPAEA